MGQFHNYTIINFNKESHEITVRFNRFDISKIIKLVIQDDKYITGDDLDNYIMSFAPVKELKENKVATNAHEIEKLVSKKYSQRLIEEKARNDNLQLRMQLLASSDWTQIHDANANLDEEDKLLWLKYRQALRDITKQSGWPLDVQWPKRPHVLGVTIFE